MRIVQENGLGGGELVQQEVEIPTILIDPKKNEIFKRVTNLGGSTFFYKVMCTRTKAEFACKLLPQSECQRATEIEIIQRLNHKHILRFHSYFQDEANFYTILELCPKQTLLELRERRKFIDDVEARYFLRQILLGVDYLHENRIIHRNLKLDSVFIDEDLRVKLSKFDLATTVDGEKNGGCVGLGQNRYMAPEVLAGRDHSFEVDIWSVGCILFALLVEEAPFETDTLDNICAKIRMGEYQIPTQNVSPAIARDLIVQMLQVEPSLRPTVKETMQHEFFTGSYIPASLPVSCLALAPRFDDQVKVVRIPIGEASRPPPVEHTSRSAGIKQDNTPYELMESLDAAMKTLLEDIEMNHARNLKVLNIDVNSRSPNSAPFLFITKWTDYSPVSSYEFGYQLSDGSIGASYDDVAIAFRPGSSSIQCVDQNGHELVHQKDQCPPEVRIQVCKLFEQNKSHNHLAQVGVKSSQNKTTARTRLPNLYTWFKTSRSVVMVLSNGTFQIDNFRDRSQIILCPVAGAISTMEHGIRMQTFKFELIKQSGCSVNLREKLKYAHQMVKIAISVKKP